MCDSEYIYLIHVHANVYHFGKLSKKDLEEAKQFVPPKSFRMLEKIDTNIDHVFASIQKDFKNIFQKIYDDELNCFIGFFGSMQSIIIEEVDINRTGTSRFQKQYEFIP